MFNSRNVLLNGMSKYLHSLALRINRNWKKEGIGEIRLVHSGKYHGKLYFFFLNNQMFSAIMGSPNLSFLDEKQTDDPVQYEIASITSNPRELQDYLKHLEELKCRDISENIEILERYKLQVDKDLNSKVEQQQDKIMYRIFS
ncbi:hypothetical protein OVS_00665 [Mycoplasma ovis str. Michigan]|uniref:Restriction endonuclease type II NgoFVII N-terminal domain-containing protein n=1 Tax=Mycoplasma ovis str. Michigan TaxID=1415773 RepID=A0ABM5P114_9MOLU|nr:hypothetical protein OVS_00665 [Mycoplasma ovis str. Michigan]